MNREAFEKHIDDCIISEVGSDIALRKDSQGEYVVDWVAGKWVTWQAATAAARVAQMQGEAQILAAERDNLAASFERLKEVEQNHTKLKKFVDDGSINQRMYSAGIEDQPGSKTA